MPKRKGKLTLQLAENAMSHELRFGLQTLGISAAALLLGYYPTVRLAGPATFTSMLAGVGASLAASWAGAATVALTRNRAADFGPSNVVMAAMLVMPAMTLALEVAGLLGMTTVMRGFGFPLVTIARQVQIWVTTTDLYGGLFKAMCFGVAVAAIGCRAGLGTGVGPRAVGLSTTAAVVGGIVATIVLDGIFALIFYRLNI